MLYEIINMSDKYTIDCPDTEIATAACVVIGNGQYAFQPLEGNPLPDVPLFIFGVDEKFIKEHCNGQTFEQMFDKVMTTRKDELASALDSVHIGGAEDRKTYPDEKQRTQAHDARRSSMNDIGRRAWALARKLRGSTETVDDTPQQVFVG